MLCMYLKSHLERSTFKVAMYISQESFKQSSFRVAVYISQESFRRKQSESCGVYILRVIRRKQF